MTDTSAQPAGLGWRQVAGAWLGIGTSPGALLVGAGIAARYSISGGQGRLPVFSALLAVATMAALLWFQGRLGLLPPHGEGVSLNEVARRYCTPGMQRALAALIGLGMIGWFGFNIGLGGAALGAWLRLPGWAGPLLLGLPVTALALRGVRVWNRLAMFTTLVVVALVALVTFGWGARQSPLSFEWGHPLGWAADVAAFAGYVSVFSVRAPDFSARLATRKDLAIVILLLCAPLLLIALAGINLFQGAGSSDLVGVLSSGKATALGNVLIALAVVAPTLTTYHSGVPAIRAALGWSERPAMVLLTVVGLGLAVARFDRRLIDWVVVLAASLPPLVIPLAVEAARRRSGLPAQKLSAWVWLPGASLALVLTLVGQPLAPLFGFAAAGLSTLIFYQNRAPTVAAAALSPQEIRPSERLD